MSNVSRQTHKLAERGFIYFIPWTKQGASLYLYGSEVNINGTETMELKHSLMPAGTKIAEWESHTNYQAARKDPTLPALKEGQEYVFRVSMEEDVPEGILFRLDFYDRQQELIEHQILRERCETFLVPEGTYNYTLQMIQAGAQQICFRHAEIYNKSLQVYKPLHRSKKTAEFCIMFLEPTGNCAPVPGGWNLFGVSNLIVVPHLFPEEKGWQQELLDLWKLREDNLKTKRFVFMAYGTKGIEAAEKAKRAWKFGKAVIRPLEYENRNYMIPAMARRTVLLRDWIQNEKNTEKIL